MSLHQWFRDVIGPYPSRERAIPVVEDEYGQRHANTGTIEVTKPRLAVVNRAPSREEFAAWRDDAVTQFVMTALRRAAVTQFEHWSEVSWAAQNPDEMLLTELRTRADAYNAIEEADYEAFCEWAGVEPEGI